MSNPKVFEFAKEIGMTPLALMDKIREWHLPVKSHMSELDAETLSVIKAKMSEGKKPAAGDKKAVAKKKAAPAAVAGEEKKPAAKKAVAKTPAKAATAKAGAKPAAAAVKAKAGAKVEAPSAKAGTVVRRKAKTDPEPEAAVEEEQIETAAPEVVEARAAEPVEEAPAKVAASEEPESPAVKKVAGGPARKKEVAIGQSGIGSEMTPAMAGVRRNIVGRMDLSRVAPPPGSRPGQDRGGPGRPQSTGPGGARPKGNIRAGFIQAPIAEPLPESSDFRGRKDDKRRPNKGAADGAAAARGNEEQPASFDAAEFRKREMVFQPKKKKTGLARPSMQTQITTPKASKRIVKVFGMMKVGDIAIEMGIKATELIKVLMKNGVMATVNMDLDFDTIALIAPDFGFEAQNSQRTAEEILVETAFGDVDSAPVPRPPVVTIMGHVDHGKTTLLDTIRKANVASGEAGGITQHIGAYQVELEDKSLITFLDTPGHEAFTMMRARGANVTDIAVIVVAADDGVMPQTAEAINHAKAAEVPMIVAVNKIDKPGANVQRIKQQLTEYEVVAEEWGGTTIFCEVSALKKTGIKELLEQLKVLAEVQELKANPKRSGTGTVIEARLEKGRGSVASILVQDGTVEVGQYIVAGTVWGKVRSLINYKGERVTSAGPSTPVEVQGLDGVPMASDRFDIVKDEKTAEKVAGVRREAKEAAKQVTGKLSLEEIFSKINKGDVQELSVILKTDVGGSMEAIQGMFAKLSTPEVKLKVIHSAIGGISESDVTLASSAKGIIIGFNVRPDSGAAAEAKRIGVDIRTYSIVYEMVDDIKKAMTGLLTPDIVEKVMGRAEVRNVFSIPKIGAIAGCSVTDGKIQRSNMARLIRDGKIVYEGKISSLKRFKDDAKEVATGFECGIGIENFNDIKTGDVIEAFMKEEIQRELSSPAEA